MIRFDNVVSRLQNEYIKAKANKIVRKPMSYALYKVWCYYDAIEEERGIGNQ